MFLVTYSIIICILQYFTMQILRNAFCVIEKYVYLISKTFKQAQNIILTSILVFSIYNR